MDGIREGIGEEEVRTVERENEIERGREKESCGGR